MGPHFQRGQALFELKRYWQAIEAYQAELAANPEAPLAYATMAAAYINLNRTNDADHSIQRALKLAPDLAYAHYILSFVHERRRNLSDAERAIAESVRLEPSVNAFYQWALIALKRGRPAEALAATQQALQLHPSHNPSILLRGRLLAQAGRLGEAHALFASALANEPNSAAAHQALGNLQLQTGQAGQALGLLREARRLDPIRANDAGAIALAYGRMLPVLRGIDCLILRWPVWSAKKRWGLFTCLAGAATAGGVLAGVTLDRPDSNPAWTAICIAAAIYLFLPFMFDRLAQTIGYFALHREFRQSWRLLLRRPLNLLVLSPILCGALIAGMFASVPATESATCLFGASFPLVSASLQFGSGRIVGYIGIPALFVLMIVGCLGGVLLESEEAPIGAAMIAVAFIAAYFSDNFVNWAASGRFKRRSPLPSSSP